MDVINISYVFNMLFIYLLIKPIVIDRIRNSGKHIMMIWIFSDEIMRSDRKNQA